MKRLIIFDCDGTLVDSETLYAGITSRLLMEMGLREYTPELCHERFAGHSWTTLRTMLEDAHDIDIGTDLIDRYTQNADRAMEKELQATAHAHDVLSALHERGKKLCVASNGERSNVIKSLSITGLNGFFEPARQIFTKIQVERPKPHPDLFLYAAEQMGYHPQDCLVIEDSPTGVTAGKAAGMLTFGFTGTSANAEKAKNSLTQAGADRILTSLIHIIDALEEA